MRFLCLGWASLVLFATLGTNSAPAADITFLNQTVDLNGTGFGNVYSLLALQATGSQTSEFGSVLWNGSMDILSGNAKPAIQTNTQPASIIQAITNANNHFGLIFNINQPGSNPNVVLHDFSLAFQDPNGGILFTATYNAPPGGIDLLQVDNGNGSAGYLFDVSLTNAEAALFFADPNNHLGQFITEANGITNVQGGPENFFLQSLGPDAGAGGGPDPGPGPGPGPGPHHMPEPGSLLIWSVFGACAVGFGARSLRRARRRSRAG